MHRYTEYEDYIQSELQRYGWPVEENDFPFWLAHEYKIYYWLFRLGRSMYNAAWYSTVSKQMLKRIDHIPEIRLLKYRDVSPSLMDSLYTVTSEFKLFREELKSEKMWRKPYLLSRSGVQRWKEVQDIVYKSMQAIPDPEWRENWEKEKVYPFCTRREAEDIARKYIKEHIGINLDDPDIDKQYFYHSKAKDGLFKFLYKPCTEDGHKSEYECIIVDMLARKVI